MRVAEQQPAEIKNQGEIKMAIRSVARKAKKPARARRPSLAKNAKMTAKSAMRKVASFAKAR
jgi:hypothetical protein